METVKTYQPPLKPGAPPPQSIEEAKIERDQCLAIMREAESLAAQLRDAPRGTLGFEQRVQALAWRRHAESRYRELRDHVKAVQHADGNIRFDAKFAIVEAAIQAVGLADQQDRDRFLEAFEVLRDRVRLFQELRADAAERKAS